MDATAKPIGYWLKHLHNLIEAHFEATLADLGLSRRHWQIFNVLSDAPRTPAQLEQALAPFWQDQEPRLDAVVDELVTRGWVTYEAAGKVFALTEQGRASYGEVAARVGEARRKLMQGLTSEQYLETVRLLSVMAANIETALTERTARSR